MLNLGKRPIAGAYYGSQKIGSMYVGSRKIYGGGSRPSVPGFVGGWKAYGRSNSEDAFTRDILPDYSGNGRDIRLYNFAFSGMSGYGGYAVDFNDSEEYYSKTAEVVSSTTMKMTLTRPDWFLTYDAKQHSFSAFLVRVSGITPGSVGIEYIYVGTDQNSRKTIKISSDGIYSIPESPLFTGDSETAPIVGFYNRSQTNGDTVIIEQLPLYPGGLVSDGVDDYGKCIKGFSLPDDFTVVAIRKIIAGNSANLVNKGSVSGAFLFEGLTNSGQISNYSYGQISYESELPALFSYLSKTSYNGNDITSGTAVDDNTDLLSLFTSSNKYQNTVLYDLRIYDHSLSDEELQLVKDEMMADYEKHAKPLDGIHYVCDFDAKGRNNDEEEPARSQWVDKANDKIIDLHNFAFAGLSGWNGYAEDFLDWESGDIRIKITNNSFTVPVSFGSHPVLFKRGGYSTPAMRIKVSGLTKGEIIYTYNDSELSFTIERDGVYDLPESVSSPESTARFANRFQFSNNSANVTVEQLPLYPGALVSDGVDDYGATREAINEEVGTIICHYKNLRENPPGTPSGRFSYIYEIVNSRPDSDNDRMYMACTGINAMIMGKGGTYNSNEPLSSHSKIPKNYDNKMNLFARVNSITEIGYAAIYRLILIQEQLDDAQVEFLRWKVEKEYRDWCLENGYDYAVNQLTE